MTSVLVVEDSPTQAEELRLVLESAGFATAVTRSSEEALDWLAARHRCDLVLSDVVMPGLSGYELCQRVKQLYADLPVVLLTTLSDPLDIIRGLECGADNFVTKPYRAEILVSRIRSLLETRRLRAEGKLRVGVEILFLGRRITITSERAQVLDVLIAAVEEIVRANRALQASQTELAAVRATAEGYASLLDDRAALSEERYRRLMEQAEDAIVLLDEELRVIEINPGGERLLARPASEIVGRPAGELLAGEVDELRERLRQRSRFRTDGLLACLPDGRRVPLEASLSTLDLGRTSWALAMLRDVSERKRQERRLLAQNAIARQIAEGTEPDGVLASVLRILVEVVGAEEAHLWSADGELPALVTSWRREATTQSVVLPVVGELVERCCRERRVLWNGADGVGSAAQLVFPLLGDPSRGAVELRGPAVENPDPGLVEMLRSVGTELGLFFDRRDAEQRLRQSEQRYRSLFEGSPLPMWVYDRPSGRILEANRAAAEHYGYTTEELCNLTLFDLRSPEESARLGELHRHPPRSQAGIWRHRRKDGSEIDVDVHTHEVTLGDREARLAVIRDVTENRRLQAELLQSQKMEAVGQLAGGIAHDFNNLLTAIGGNAELAQLHRDLPAPVSEALSDIRDACQRAAHLTRQLLAFSQKQVVRHERIELNGVLRGMERMLRRVLREDIRMELGLADAALPLVADRNQLDQVMLNLVVNARDAMPQGGRLSIETRVVTVGDDHPALAPGRYVQLTVSDTGSGMDEATRVRIFEPFFTTKGSRGTGLGLAMVYGIVHQSHGTIRVDSAPGKGTTFELSFPEHSESLGAPSAGGDEPPQTPH